MDPPVPAPGTIGPAPGTIGLVLPTFVQDTTPAWAQDRSAMPWPSVAESAADVGDDPIGELRSLCGRAEELGARALWACDHLFWHRPCLESMVALTVAATATERSTVGTCVLQLPLRRASAVAKQAASLQSLTRGRVVLGVGVGRHPGEYEQVGADYHGRGRDLDAGIAELRRSWASAQDAGPTGRPPGAGEHYRQLPEPLPIPVWIGGSSEAALRRAAQVGDGWMPLFLAPGEYRDALDRLAKEMDRSERPSGSVRASIVLFVSVDDDPVQARRRGGAWMSTFYGLPPKAFDRHLVTGTAAQVAETVGQFARAGAQHVAIYVADDNPMRQFEQLMAALPAADVPGRE